MAITTLDRYIAVHHFESWAQCAEPEPPLRAAVIEAAEIGGKLTLTEYNKQLYRSKLIQA